MKGGRERIRQVGVVGIIDYRTHFGQAGLASDNEVCIITNEYFY